MTRQTREKWAERIREWRASGLAAEEFTAGKDYEASSLRWAVSQLEGKKTSQPKVASSTGPRMSRRRMANEQVSLSSTREPRFVPVRIRHAEPGGTEVLVEVAGAQIRVTRGVDVGLLRDVVRALQGVGQ